MTRAKKTKGAAKKPTETTWEELPRKEREKLAKQIRASARFLMTGANRLRRKADTRAPYWAASDRRAATSYEKDAACRAALADLIERNLGGAS